MERSDLTSHTVTQGDHVTLHISGDLDLTTTSTFVSAAMEALQGTPERLTIDASGLRFCDSSGLSGFVQVWKAAERSGISVHVTHPRPQLARVMEMTALARMFLTDPAER